MRVRSRHLLQLILAAAALAGAALCWSQVKAMVDVAPVTDGQPATVSAVYDPPMMILSMLLATAAGVLAVLGVAGLRRVAPESTLDTYTP